MNVGFRYSSIWNEFGDSDLLHSFFSSICYHLESCNWGSKYEYMLKKFYYEKLNAEEIEYALKELINIRLKFKELRPQDIIWDIEDTSKKTPDNYLLKSKALDLSECFISKGGKNIFDILLETFEFCNRKKFSIKIQSESELTKDIFQ